MTNKLAFHQDLLLAEGRIEQAVLNSFYEVGQELRFIKDNELYLPAYKNWPIYCKERWEWSRSHADQMIAATDVYNTLSDTATTDAANGIVLPKRERHVRPLLKLPSSVDQIEVWNEVVKHTNGDCITAKVVEDKVNIKLQEIEDSKETIEIKQKQISFYTLSQWDQLSDTEKQVTLQSSASTNKFNPTNDNIEWAKWSWNPITGCLHNCVYCYARDIANRFYNHLPENERFSPVFYPDRLSAPENTKLPDLSSMDDEVIKMGKQNVFVCSMADLFGKWVPEEWIEAVLSQIRSHPEWNFLLLTKFPIRMSEFEYPPNTWLGTTVDYQWAVDRAEKGFRKLRDSGYKGITWLSCEPMMENLEFGKLDMFDWIVMGGSSKSTQSSEFKPPFNWIVNLYKQARQSNCKVYFKTNLLPGISDDQRIREYPARENY